MTAPVAPPPEHSPRASRATSPRASRATMEDIVASRGPSRRRARRRRRWPRTSRRCSARPCEAAFARSATESAAGGVGGGVARRDPGPARPLRQTPHRRGGRHQVRSSQAAGQRLFPWATCEAAFARSAPEAQAISRLRERFPNRAEALIRVRKPSTVRRSASSRLPSSRRSASPWRRRPMRSPSPLHPAISTGSSPPCSTTPHTRKRHEGRKSRRHETRGEPGRARPRRTPVARDCRAPRRAREQIARPCTPADDRIGPDVCNRKHR